MFRKNSSIFTIIGLLLFSLIAVTSCGKDDDLYTIDNITIKQKMTGSRTSLSQIKRENHDLFNFISDRALSIAKSSNSSNGTILDTTHIQVLEGVDFKNYIFKVTQDSTTRSNELKNYMLVILKDSIQHQYMVTYPYVNQVIDTTNVVIEPVFGTDILNQVTLKCGGGSFQSVWVPGGYVDIYCQGGDGPHILSDGPGNGGADGCKYYGGKGSASRLYYEGYFTTQYVEQQPCETIDPGNPGNGGGGPVGDVPPPPDDNSDDDDDNNVDEEPDITVGVTPNDGLQQTDPECNYLEGLLNDNDFASRLNQLIQSAQDDNFEYIHEYTVDSNGNDLPFFSDHGGDHSSTAPARNLPNSILRPIIVHTHYKGNTYNGTISMFSMPDIITFTKDILKVHAYGDDTSQMTSILVAANSTTVNVYAIKKDPNSTIANNYNFHQNVALGMTEAEKKKEREDYQNAIQKSDSQEELEIAALKQFEKMGLHLYKTTNVHSGWEQLTLDPNSADPKKPKVESSSCN